MQQGWVHEQGSTYLAEYSILNLKRVHAMRDALNVCFRQSCRAMSNLHVAMAANLAVGLQSKPSKVPDLFKYFLALAFTYCTSRILQVKRTPCMSFVNMRSIVVVL